MIGIDHCNHQPCLPNFPAKLTGVDALHLPPPFAAGAAAPLVVVLLDGPEGAYAMVLTMGELALVDGAVLGDDRPYAVEVVVEECARVGEVRGLGPGDYQRARVHLPLVVPGSIEANKY